MMDEASVMNCCGCWETFDSTLRCPRMLKCLHAICTSCVDHLITNGEKQCSSCGKDFNATCSNDIPVYQIVIEFMEYAKGLRERSAEGNSMPVSSLLMNGFSGHNNGLNRLWHQTRIFGIHHTGKNRGGYSQHGEFVQEDDLYGKVTNSDIKTCPLCCQEYDGSGRLPRTFNCLHTVCTSCLAELIRRDAKTCPFCRKGFRASRADDILVNHTVLEFVKYLKDLEINLRYSNSSNVSRNGEGLGEYSYPEECFVDSATIDGHQIRAEDLMEMNSLTRSLLQEERVFAIQKNSREETRIARITYAENQKLCLHHLCDEQLPRRGCYVEHCELMGMMDNSARLVFLELSFMGSTLGRLYIRLPQDNKGTHHFSLLCTGEMGPSYADSNAIKVWGKGTDEEQVLFGDYEKNSGSGGMTLFPNEWREENDEIYRRPWQAGTVTGIWNVGDRVGAQFLIHTRDNPNNESFPEIGVVEEGLHILSKAIENYPNIRYIVIEDCGIVLPV